MLTRRGVLHGKMRRFIKNNQGFSTLEVLIASALLTLAVFGVIVIVFGNDGFSLDSRLNNEALFWAKTHLNEARAQADSDFLGLTDSTSTEDGGRYTGEVNIIGLTPCKNLIESTVSWSPTPLRPQSVTLETVVASVEEFLKLNSDCPDEPSGEDDWKDPSSLQAIDFNPSGVQATDIDYSDGYVYITSDADSKEKDDLWVIDVQDPEVNIEIVGQVNTDDATQTKKPYGLNAVDVAGDYAYVARNASTTQFMVLDISNPASPFTVATSTLPGVGNSYPEGRSIYYYDNRVYIGTHETAGNEFHVYDVSTPTNPVWRGSLGINNNVHDIVVRGNYAYIATSGNARELQIIDISNPASPNLVTQYNVGGTGGNDADGTALYLVGNTLYLGREYMKDNENLFVIDITNPLSPSLLGSETVLLKNDTEIVGIVATGHIAFISTTNSTDTFQIWDVSDPSDMELWTCTFNYSESPAALDFDGKYVYVANQSQNALRVIWNDPTNSCKK